jgi:hypothetical protein
MRSFAKPSGLERLSLEARIVYTGFCLFLLFGYGTSAWIYADDELGLSAASAERYYLGEDARSTIEHTALAKTEIVTGGPRIDVPESDAPGLRLAKPPRQVMETFHFHLFSVPVVLLIVAHLFMMSRMTTRTKASIIALASLATFVHIALPPLIRFAHPSLAALLFPSALAMGVLWTYMTFVPVYEMWRFASYPRRAPSEIDSASG